MTHGVQHPDLEAVAEAVAFMKRYVASPCDGRLHGLAAEVEALDPDQRARLFHELLAMAEGWGRILADDTGMTFEAYMDSGLAFFARLQEQ